MTAAEPRARVQERRRLGNPQGRGADPGGLGTGWEGPACHLVNKPRGAARHGTWGPSAWPMGGQDAVLPHHPCPSPVPSTHSPGTSTHSGRELDLNGMLGEGQA